MLGAETRLLFTLPVGDKYLERRAGSSVWLFKKKTQHPAEQRRVAETLGKPVLPVPLDSGGTDLLQTLTAPQIYGTNVSLAAVKTRWPDRPDALLHLKVL